ncbi:dipeptidyl-peptidase III [Planoprotostelium fungivorum]|uniref:Dipeptidyl peptidase 3 n=1 Tax=Planoprotostelium fungivorum TaxID=1890364 RepID=A0A2P6NN52_9EUKA|nr:dipeptidyl-peptidase III [Planoprotostelium fungivorum]
MTETYLAPLEQPVFRLEISKAFEALTQKEKLYAHFLSQGSWEGSLICFHQTSVESWPLFLIFQKYFRSLPSLDSEDEDFKQLLQFAAAFYGNQGNYRSFGDTKILPRLSKEKFRGLLEKVSEEKTKKELLALFDQWADRIYNSEEKYLSLGLEEKGVSTYFSENITKADIEIANDFLKKKKNISPYNTRLWKHEEGGKVKYEIKTASAHKKPKEVYEHNGHSIEVTYGDHSEHLQKTADHIREAGKYIANDNQKEMISKYVEHFEGGSIEAHKDSQRAWIRDIQPVVENNIGFIESYRDPDGARGEFEGLVAIVNKEVSKKFEALVKGAEQFITKLPWPKEFEKDKFLKPDFTSLEVLTFASSGVPSGINIPNYDDIRQTEGFKNVSLGNVLSAKPKEAAPFIREEDQELYQSTEGPAFEVQVGIHELLGHGTGKLLQIDESGKKNFPEDLVHPLTLKKIDKWYKPGETYDTVFRSWASTIEECRAESCGIYLSTDENILRIFGHSNATSEEVHDVTYINWLLMCRAGLVALEFYTPSTGNWGQAHMQARFAILNVLLEAGQGLVQLEKTSNDVRVVLDRSKIKSVGREAIGRFLNVLQAYKSTADAESLVSFYSKYSTPNGDFLALRDVVLSQKKPRRVFVQAHTFVEGGDVKVKEFEPTPQGIVRSYLERFPSY